MEFSWRVLLKWWPEILQGLKVTLIYFSLSAVSSVLVAIVLAGIGALDNPVLNVFVRLYSTIFRDTPLLITLFFLFYALPALGIRLPIFVTGVLGITLNESAYMAEIFRGSLQSIREGNWEAGATIALTKSQVIRYIILPQTIRDAIPAITGQISIVLKDTSYLALIMVTEIYAMANRVYTYEASTTGFLAAAVIYIALFWIINISSQALEERVRVRR